MRTISEVKVKLGEIAHGRSGDKGDMVNIGLICHEKQWLPLLESIITPELLSQWFSGWSEGPFEVYSVPGIGAVNCLIHKVLQGGGTVARRLDAQGKALGQIVLESEVGIDVKLAKEVGFIA